MFKLIHLFHTLCPSDIGVGPSKFSRCDGESEPTSTSIQLQETITTQTIVGHVDHVNDLSYQEPSTTPTYDVQSLYTSGLDDEKQEAQKDEKACPSGGCPPDKKLIEDIYNDAIKQEAKKSNLNLDDASDRHTAHMNILSWFRQRIHQNNKYEQQDKEGPSIAEGPTFIFKDGRIYYEEFGKSLQQMYEDQKRIRPKQYDPREHATMTLMEAAFVAGATKVEHVSHYKDKDGKDAIRDKITMIIDPVTGKGRMEIRNIATAEGHNLSMKEAYDKMTQHHDGFIEGHPSEGIFILTDAPIPSKQVHEILSAVQQPRVAHDESMNQTSAPQYVATEFIENVDPSLSYIHNEKQNIRIPVFMQKLLGYSQEQSESAEIHAAAKATLLSILTDEENNLSLKALTTTPVDSIEMRKEKGNLSAVWQRVVEKVLGVSPEQSRHVLVELGEAWHTLQKAEKIILFLVATKVGISGASPILESLASFNFELLETQEKNEADVKSEITPVLFLEKDSGFVINADAFQSIITSLLKDKYANISLTENLKKGEVFNTEAMKSPDRVLITWLTQFIATLDKQTSEEAILRVETEEKRVMNNFQLLWEVFVEFFDKKEKHIDINEVDSSQSIPTKVERQTIREFSFAVALWMMLEFISYYQSLQSLKKAFMSVAHALKDEDKKKNKLDEINSTVKSQLAEDLIQSEMTQGLLAAIIWHLAQIREQGMRTKTQPTKKVKKPAKQHTTLNIYDFGNQGVIYAYGS